MILQNLGYGGYIPGIKSENVYGETYGKTTFASSAKTFNRGMDQPTGTRVGECKAGPPKPQPALNASDLCIFPRLIKALRPVAAPIFLKQVSGDDLEKVHFIRSRAFLHKPLF